MAPVLTVLLLLAQPASTPAQDQAAEEQLEEPAPLPVGLILGPLWGGTMGGGACVLQWALLAVLTWVIVYQSPCLGDPGQPRPSRLEMGLGTAAISGACMLFSSPLVLITVATADALGLAAGQLPTRGRKPYLVRDMLLGTGLLVPTVAGALLSMVTCCGLGCLGFSLSLFGLVPTLAAALMSAAALGGLGLAALTAAWWVVAAFVLRPIAMGLLDHPKGAAAVLEGK